MSMTDGPATTGAGAERGWAARVRALSGDGENSAGVGAARGRAPSGGGENTAAERPMRADAQRNYAKLLSAASAAFTESGADDVSLEGIARRAGVGIGTLYRHF